MPHVSYQTNLPLATQADVWGALPGAVEPDVLWEIGATAYVKANQLSEDDFEILDHLAFNLENGLLRLIESLERKRDSRTWSETLIISESNSIYTSENPDHL
jgi:hypothetical protein